MNEYRMEFLLEPLISVFILELRNYYVFTVPLSFTQNFVFLHLDYTLTNVMYLWSNNVFVKCRWPNRKTPSLPLVSAREPLPSLQVIFLPRHYLF